MYAFLKARKTFILLIAVAAAIHAISIILLSGALLAGYDEAMEISKARHFALHKQSLSFLWNDQPWLLTQMVALVGPYPDRGRFVVAAVSILSLLFLLQRVGIRTFPDGIGVLAVLYSWPFMPSLLVAVMPEWVGFAIGLAAVGALCGPKGRESVMLAPLISGGLLGIAANVKLTSLMVLPTALAMIVLPLIMNRGQLQRLAVKDAGLKTLVLLGSLALSFVCFAMLAPSWSLDSLLGSHLSAAATEKAKANQWIPTEWLLAAPGVMFAAVLGCVVLWRERRIELLVMGVTLLVVAVCVHLIHRPFWYYYGVHFSVPLACFASVGVCGGIRRFMERDVAPAREGFMLLACLALGAWISFDCVRMADEISGLRKSQRADDNIFVKRLREYPSRWVFSRSSEIAYHAGHDVPPELVILAKKRFWVGAITEEDIVACVKKYNCDALLLKKDVELVHSAWTQFLSTGEFELALEDYDYALLLKKSLIHPPVRASLKKEL